MKLHLAVARRAEHPAVVAGVRGHHVRLRVGVEGEEIQRGPPLLQEIAELDEAAVTVLLLLGHGPPLKRQRHVDGVALSVAADLEVRELGLEVPRRHVVEFAELPPRPAPHLVAVVDEVVRLVPDFPVGDFVVEAVRPALGVVADDMLADARPLREVLRREDAVGGADASRVVLNGDAESEVWLHAIRDKRVEVKVREREVIAGGVVLVCLEVAKKVRDVDV